MARHVWESKRPLRVTAERWAWHWREGLVYGVAPQQVGPLAGYLVERERQGGRWEYPTLPGMERTGWRALRRPGYLAAARLLAPLLLAPSSPAYCRGLLLEVLEGAIPLSLLWEGLEEGCQQEALAQLRPEVAPLPYKRGEEVWVVLPYTGLHRYTPPEVGEATYCGQSAQEQGTAAWVCLSARHQIQPRYCTTQPYSAEGAAREAAMARHQQWVRQCEEGEAHYRAVLAKRAAGEESTHA